MTLSPRFTAVALTCAVGSTLMVHGRALPAAQAIDTLPVVVPNDNRVPAGTVRNGVLELELVASMARWYPEDDGGASAEVMALSVAGGPPQIPAPLIRVPRGTVVEATFRNALRDSALWVYWSDTLPTLRPDSVAIAPGASRTLRLHASGAGTYMYRAIPGRHDVDVREREQAAGAIVIDEPGVRVRDRIFVINIWSDPDSARDRYFNALTINGKSWPHTERLTATTGDSVRWRVVNATVRPHPMHLHGFYFRVDSRGTATFDSIYAPARRRLGVTEDMSPFTTMSMTWVPERPGNWLFHCHLAFHVVGGANLEPSAHDAHQSADPEKHMAGLVMGIAVKGAPDYREPVRAKPLKMKLFVNEGSRRGIAPRALGFVQQRGPRAPALDSVEIPGSTLVLTRGQPADITVFNRLQEATSVHWHGVELESYSDGVAGWSGMQRLAPVVAPGRSFTARLTLPRAGTFIYHTHLNDIEQITSGLYGALLVMEPGESFDPTRDHVYVAGWDGADDSGDTPPIVINGDTAGAALILEAGVEHRFRFVNIGPAQRIIFELRSDGGASRQPTTVSWMPAAKDGAQLPSHQATASPAWRRLGVGETFDAVMTPEPGSYTFIARLPGPEGKVVYRQDITFAAQRR